MRSLTYTQMPPVCPDASSHAADAVLDATLSGPEWLYTNASMKRPSPPSTTNAGRRCPACQTGPELCCIVSRRASSTGRTASLPSTYRLVKAVGAPALVEASMHPWT